MSRDVAGRFLVSCIMPTANRRRFVPLAIRYFLAQDYPNKELVILDDGTDSVSDLIPDDPQIRYMRLSGKRSLGAKRNECVEASRGDIILHWDDDDWYAPWRLRYQVEQLQLGQADICGLDHIYFYDPERGLAWLYRYESRGMPWVYGCTLCYTRAFWQAHRFPNLNMGEDARFVWSDTRSRIAILEDNRLCVALIHPHNTSPKRTSHKFWHTASVEVIREIMGSDYAGCQPQQVDCITPAAAPQPVLPAIERTLSMFAAAHESDLSLPEFTAFNHGQDLPRMRRWEMPFALFQARLPNTGAILDCTINPVNFQERLNALYPHILYRHWNPVQDGRFVLPIGMPDESFDRVICINTLEHLLAPQREALIAVMGRKLKPGGRLILTSDYYFDRFWEQPEFLDTGVMRRDRQEVFNGWNKVTVREWVDVCRKYDLHAEFQTPAEPVEDDVALYRQLKPHPHATIGGVFYKGSKKPPHMSKKIVLALLTWNTCAITVESVRAYLREAQMLERLGQEVVLCICDNGSTDGTQDALRAIEPQIDISYRPILNDENRGNSIARNQIIKFARECSADYLLFMDGDIEIVPFSSFSMLRYMENSGSQLGCIGADSASQTSDRMRTSPCLYTIDHRRVETTNLVAWTQYGMFRCEMFDNGVGFDESYPFNGPGWGFEDNDLAFQMDMKGYVNQRFFGMTYLHRAAHSSIQILKGKGVNVSMLYELRKQYVINKWTAAPDINNGPLALVRRVTMRI